MLLVHVCQNCIEVKFLVIGSDWDLKFLDYILTMMLFQEGFAAERIFSLKSIYVIKLLLLILKKHIAVGHQLLCEMPV